MSAFDVFKRVSRAPTNPGPATQPRQIDVAELYQGVVTLGSAPDDPQQALDEKLRQAYFWIVNNAIISPHYDIEYNDVALGLGATFLY